MRKSPAPCEYVSFVQKVTALVGEIAAFVPGARWPSAA